MSRTRSFVAVLLLLTACALPPPGVNPDPGPYPEKYRALVEQWLQETLFDPYSVRDLEVTVPVEGTLWQGLLLGGHLPVWTVCATFNAKNRFGGYTGRSTTVLFIRNNSVIATEGYWPDTISSYSCLAR